MDNILTAEKQILAELVAQRQKQEAAVLEAERQGKELAAERWRQSPEGRKAIAKVEATRAELHQTAERIVRDVLRLASEAEEVFSKMGENDTEYRKVHRVNSFRSLASAAEFRAFVYVRGALEKLTKSISLYRR